MVRIGEIRKKSVEVGVEIRKFAKRREGLAHALAPPVSLEATKLVGPKPKPEGEARRGTESAAKTGGDGILGGVEAKLPREAGVGASDRLARLEQRAGGVEKYGADQEIGTVTEFRLSLTHGLRRRLLGAKDRGAPTRRRRTARRMRGDRFWVVRRHDGRSSSRAVDDSA